MSNANEGSKPTVTEEQIFEALKEVFDPEIPVNIVELGLIYEVKIVEDWVGVKMTLTTPGCGMSGMISQNVKDRVLKIDGVKETDVRIVWQPAWSPARMTEAARKKVGMA